MGPSELGEALSDALTRGDVGVPQESLEGMWDLMISLPTNRNFKGYTMSDALGYTRSLNPNLYPG